MMDTVKYLSSNSAKLQPSDLIILEKILSNPLNFDSAKNEILNIYGKFYIDLFEGKNENRIISYAELSSFLQISILPQVYSEYVINEIFNLLKEMILKTGPDFNSICKILRNIQYIQSESVRTELNELLSDFLFDLAQICPKSFVSEASTGLLILLAKIKPEKAETMLSEMASLELLDLEFESKFQEANLKLDEVSKKFRENLKLKEKLAYLEKAELNTTIYRTDPL